MSEAAALTTDRLIKGPDAHCKHGHVLRGQIDLVKSRTAKNGQPVWRCRVCAKEADARWRARQNAVTIGLEVPDEALLRVTRHPATANVRRPAGPKRGTGSSVVEPETANVTLMSVLPKDLRFLIARALMDDTTPRGIAYVLDKATRRSAFHHTPPALAAALWVQSVLDITADLPSAEFRCDRVLAYVLSDPPGVTVRRRGNGYEVIERTG